MGEFIQMMTTIDSKEGAQKLAKSLVEKRLAACTQVIGPIMSTYWWQGKIETAEEWLCLMKTRQEIGIAGCRLVREDGTLDHAAKRSFPTPLSAVGHFTGLGRREGAPPRLAAYRAPEVEAGVVDAVNGAFMLMRRAALEEVGLFDEGYWMYMEDLDLCYRFAEGGWTTWYEPSVSVVHVKHGTSGHVRSPQLERAFHYGMYRFYRKHYARHQSLLVNGAVYAGIGVRLGWRVARSAVMRAAGGA